MCISKVLALVFSSIIGDNIKKRKPFTLDYRRLLHTVNNTIAYL